MDVKSVSRNLQLLRRRTGMTIDEAAAHAGVSANTMLRHEHGFDMTVTQLFGYARAIGCSINDILYGPLPPAGQVGDDADERLDAEIEMLGRKHGLEVIFTTREEIFEEMLEEGTEV